MAVVDLGPAAASSMRVVQPEADEPDARAGRIAWMTDERAARDRAARERVPLLVVFLAAWSVPSVTLEATTLADPRVVRAARGAATLRVDVSDVDASREVLQRFAVATAPTVIVLAPDGGETFRRSDASVDPDALERALLDE